MKPQKRNRKLPQRFMHADSKKPRPPEKNSNDSEWQKNRKDYEIMMHVISVIGQSTGTRRVNMNIT